MNRAFSSVYSLSSRILEDMVKFAAGVNQWTRNLLVTRFVEHQPPSIAIEALRMEESLASSLEPLRISFASQMPSTKTMSSLLTRIRDEANQLTRLSQERMVTPPAVQLSALRDVESAAGSVDELLKAGHEIGRTSPIVTAGGGMSPIGGSRSMYLAGHEALQYSSHVSEATSEAYEVAGPKLTESLSAAMEGPKPFILGEKELPELMPEEAVAPPSVSAGVYEKPRPAESVRVARERVDKVAREVATSLASTFSETMEEVIVAGGLFSAAPIVRRSFEGLMGKEYEGLQPEVPPVGLPMTAGPISEALRGLAALSSRARDQIRMYYPWTGLMGPVVTGYAGTMWAAGRRGFTLLGALPSQVAPSVSGIEETAVEGSLMVDVRELFAGIERHVLGAPRGVPAVPRMLKLHEAIPLMNLLSSLSQSAKASRMQRPLDVTVKVESLADERSLRELERKIAKILRDAARRYGVPL